ncbi:hypothetical protein B9G69_013800 [Bdellovibrio sp. SKB1291214]|uniref:hypothetical protein n=1 Tax=Bdellovibrio sp. SKB1291214 TaxID=1732569 RepID=UPI000B51DE0B|nr:hypothetical protein [Bdellovibrio sp. SKB1291214]UYL08120.1 hypothetical protein B9G69_013800 [Bdellovibrio sp. SKB1291214]
MKSDLFKFATCFAMMAVLASCAPTSDNSLLTDDPSNPNSHTLNTDPSSTELQLVADTYNLGTITSARYLELSGACYASTFPTHRITITVNNVTTAAANYYDMKSTLTTGYGTCRNGRYNIVLKGSALSTGSNTIVLTLTGYDSSNVASTSGNAVSRYVVIRSD